MKLYYFLPPILIACGGHVSEVSDGGNTGEPPEAIGRQSQAQATWTDVYMSNGNTVVMQPASQWYCGVVHIDNNGGHGNGFVGWQVYIRPSDGNWVLQTNGYTTVGARCLDVVSFGPKLNAIVNYPPTGVLGCPQGSTCTPIATGTATRNSGCFLNYSAGFFSGNIAQSQNQLYAAQGNQNSPWYAYQASIHPPQSGGMSLITYCPLYQPDLSYSVSWVIGLNTYNPTNTLPTPDGTACFFSGLLGAWNIATVADIDQFGTLQATITPGTQAQANYTCLILNP